MECSFVYLKREDWIFETQGLHTTAANGAVRAKEIGIQRQYAQVQGSPTSLRLSLRTYTYIRTHYMYLYIYIHTYLIHLHII